MDLLSSVVASLAWPLAIVAVAWMFKDPITTLMDKIRKASFGGVSVEISGKLDDAEKIVQEEAPEQSAASDANNDERKEALQYPPDYVVINEWRSIEIMLRKIAQSRGMTGRAQSRMTIRDLMKMDLIKPTTVALMDDLAAIRNRVAHGEAEVSQADALRFLDLASIVKADLSKHLSPFENE
ncbi:hypothetical protein [Tabrizicola fusiformis]|uniref:hypothetical protein n=1 Tax=Tabrizicola sp. SY72 TaxID=2741673 RepID=UPI001573A1ED|nr:hypothetical protein [Tabrizicola sp. SY72]NTT87388.1 hypothetical protein [Tabrizicola sp. SY72]